MAHSNRRKHCFRDAILAVAAIATAFGCGSAGRSQAGEGGAVSGGTAGHGGSGLGRGGNSGLGGAGGSGRGGGVSSGGAGTGGSSSGGAAGTGGGTGAVNGAGYRWSTVKMGGGGFVSGIVMSRARANLIFARTDVGGAYRWNEPTASWIPITDWVSDNETGLLGVESIAIDPSEPNRVYLLAGTSYFNGGKTAILRSSDYGDTFQVTEVTSQFTAHGNGMGRQSGERLAVDPNDGAVLFTGTRTKGLFKSADHGATWTRVAALDVTTTANGNGIAFVVFDPRTGSAGNSTQTMYAGISRSGQANLYRSLNAGATWTAVSGAPTTYVPQRATLASDGIMYLTYGNGAGPGGSGADTMDRGAVYRFDTQSGTFTDVSPLKGTNNRAFGGISVDPANSNRIVATTINTYQQQPWGWGDRIFVSTNAGTSWTDLFAANRVTMDAGRFPWIVNHAIHWAGSVEMDPFDPKRVFVTSGNGIFMTRDIDAAKSTWTFAVEGLEETVPMDAVSLPDGPLVSAIGDYDGFVHTDVSVSPVNGAHAPSIGTTSGVAFAHDSPSLLARVGSGLYGSTNEGASWTEWTRPTADTNGHLAFSASGDVLLWTAGSTLRRRSTNGGTWSTSSGIGFAAFPVADPLNASKFYAYDPATGRVYVSTDGGQSFANPATVASRGNARIATAPGVEGDVWIALYGGGLRRSTDSGASFQGVGSVQNCSAVGFGAPAQGKTFASIYIWGAAGGPNGVYRSDDEGATWLRINDDAHEYGGPGNAQFVIGDANVYGRVFMSSAGRGIVWGELVGN